MPLLDHFHPPVQDRCSWQTFHSAWATHLANRLNEQWLPEEFVANEHTKSGGALEIDIATFQETEVQTTAPRNGTPATTVSALPWAPPAVRGTFASMFPENFSVHVFHTLAGRELVGAIEFVSPSNKDRPAERRAFVAKCASYLHHGVSVVVLDIVTTRRANLHNETARFMTVPDDLLLPDDAMLYAASYRPVIRGGRQETDLWTERCELGQPLPTMPLRLTNDLFVPVEFDVTYQETCRRRRIIPG